MSHLLLKDRFELHAELSRTEHTATYRAYDNHHSDRPLCLVTQIFYGQEEMRSHLDHEAKTLERLSHTPYLPRVIDYFHASAADPIFGQALSDLPRLNSAPLHPETRQPQPNKTNPDISQDRHAFILVQEWIEGHPLSDEITDGKQLSESYVAKLLQDSLAGLSAFHQQGVVHQNLHPRYIVRRNADGQLFLTQYGPLARLARSQVTADGHLQVAVPVSPHPYMAPEQLQPDYARRPQPSSDLYALGLMAIEALTGKPHYHFSYDLHKGLMWRDEVDVSLPLAEFIDRLVRQNRRDRFDDAESALETLKLACDRYQIAQNSRFPTVMAAPGGRRSPRVQPPNKASGFRLGRSSIKFTTGPVSYPTGQTTRRVPPNPKLIKAFVACLAIALGIGIAVKTYQWGQYRISRLPQSWQSWTAPAASGNESRDASSDELVPLLRDGSILLRPAAAEAFWEMVAAAGTEGIEIYPLRGYRSRSEIENETAARQVESDSNSNNSTDNQRSTARSDYPSGYAVDIGGEDPAADYDLSFGQTDTFRWLDENAADYGFQLSLEEEGLLGTTSEPWHWRYVPDQTSVEETS